MFGSAVNVGFKTEDGEGFDIKLGGETLELVGEGNNNGWDFDAPMPEVDYYPNDGLIKTCYMAYIGAVPYVLGDDKQHSILVNQAGFPILFMLDQDYMVILYTKEGGYYLDDGTFTQGYFERTVTAGSWEGQSFTWNIGGCMIDFRTEGQGYTVDVIDAPAKAPWNNSVLQCRKLRNLPDTSYSCYLCSQSGKILRFVYGGKKQVLWSEDGSGDDLKLDLAADTNLPETWPEEDFLDVNLDFKGETLLKFWLDCLAVNDQVYIEFEDISGQLAINSGESFKDLKYYFEAE